MLTSKQRYGKLQAAGCLRYRPRLDCLCCRVTSSASQVFYPSEPGVVQLEAFSVHCCENGDIVYGGILEATTGCTKDKISIGALSRLIVDVGLDSSKVMVNLFDSHQTDMLNCILMDQPLKRHKFSCVIADAITTR